MAEILAKNGGCDGFVYNPGNGNLGASSFPGVLVVLKLPKRPPSFRYDVFMVLIEAPKRPPVVGVVVPKRAGVLAVTELKRFPVVGVVDAKRPPVVGLVNKGVGGGLF